MPKSDERFARQYRYEPPPKFPLASPCSGIVRYLSGTIMFALVDRPCGRPAGDAGTVFRGHPLTLHFRFAPRVSTP